MKKILFLALVAILFGCKSKDEPTKPFVIDPLATVNIKPIAGTKLKVKSVQSTDTHLTAFEIVKQTHAMKFSLSDGTPSIRGFAPLQRDTISATPMLKMWGTDIMGYTQLIDGTYTTNLVLQHDFLEAKDCILIDNKGDTIAYVPNTVLRTAETQIKELFLVKNYEPIYDVFNNAYTFIPISGTEYKALKAQNLQ